MKIKLLEGVSLPGKRYPAKGDVIDVEDEEGNRLIGSKLAIAGVEFIVQAADESAEESGEGHHKRKKK
jgi:hypothetical protein